MELKWHSFPVSSAGKQSTCNAGDSGSIPGLGRSTGEGIGHTVQYSWASLVAQLVKNLPAIWEAWVQFLGVGKIPWRRERLPTPVFRPGEFHGLYSPWDHKESDTTKQLSLFTFSWILMLAVCLLLYVKDPKELPWSTYSLLPIGHYMINK